MIFIFSLFYCINKISKNNTTFNFVGCTVEELKLQYTDTVALTPIKSKKTFKTGFFRANQKYGFIWRQLS